MQRQHHQLIDILRIVDIHCINVQLIGTPARIEIFSFRPFKHGGQVVAPVHKRRQQREGRRIQQLLKHRHDKSHGPVFRLERAVKFLHDISCCRVVEIALFRIKIEPHRLRMARGKAAHLLLRPPDENRRQLRPQPRKIGAFDTVFVVKTLVRPQEILVDQADQIIELLQLAPERRRGQQKQRFRIFRDNLRRVVRERTFQRIAPQPVRLVEDHRVPAASFESVPERGVLDKIERANNAVMHIPWVRARRRAPVGRFHAPPVEQHERFVKLVFHFVLPLYCKRRRADDEDFFIRVTIHQLLDHEARLNCFPETDLVSEEKALLERIHNTVRAFHLVGEYPCTRIRQRQDFIVRIGKPQGICLRCKLETAIERDIALHEGAKHGVLALYRRKPAHGVVSVI